MRLSSIQLDWFGLQANWKALSAIAPKHAKKAAVVKGNAYGHGMSEVVQALHDLVDYFQVDDFEELKTLKKYPYETQVLVLGYIPESQVAEAIDLGAEVAVYDIKRLQAISQANKPARIHLKIDALLGRQGLLPSELDTFLAELKKYPQIDLVAAYSHFANIEDTTDLTHSQAQTDVFEECYQRIKDAGWPNLGRHESATSGLMAREHVDSPNSLVRIGLGIYGLYPSSPLQRSHADLDLKPVMRWVSHLAQVKDLPPRHPVGYGLTYITSAETRIGIVPQGYSDGYDRGLSSSGQVLVRGKRCPVLGRVAMNMFAIDLTGVPDASPEDEVVLLGTQREETITAEEIAQRIGTINYEVTTRVSPLLPRVCV